MIFDYFRTYDGLFLRYGLQPGPEHCRGTVVFLNGRSEFMEKHTETVAGLRLRGFRVYSLDWRGQGLSTRILRNPHKGFVLSYADYLRDLRQFMTEIIPDDTGKPCILLSHSMGGHIALRYLHDFPESVCCAVMVSPMIDILTPPFPVSFSRLLTRMGIRYGYSHAYALTQKDFLPPDEKSFRRNPLTGDFERYMDEKRAVDRNPRLALGGVTYGWLQATFDSIDILRSSGYMSQVTTPLLMLSAAADRVVSVSAQKKMCRTMPNCKIITIKDSYHEILKERASVRKEFWNAFDEFVNNNS